MAAFEGRAKAIAEQLAATEDEIRNILLSVPNVPCDMVPEGKTAADNVVEKTGGPMPDLPEDALPHWELARKYNIIDFDLGVKDYRCRIPGISWQRCTLAARSHQFFLTRSR